MRSSRRTPGPLPGVFVFALLACLAAGAARADCTPERPLETVRVERIIDGDTVQLRGGQRVRLIGLNAPELARNGKPSEPLAARARQALAELLPRERDVFLETGIEARDRHGRQLAHLFQRRNGGSVEAEMLRRGLALHVVVAPNTAHVDCLARAERDARRRGAGLWREPHFAPRDSRTLGRDDAGFRRVRLQVEQVATARHGWWLEGGALAVRLARDALPRDTAACAPACWRGRAITVRGWISDRSDSRTVRERGYPPLLLRIDHPAMIESTPADVSAAR
jgi:endonuclease YncB( thermonuclease family)